MSDLTLHHASNTRSARPARLVLALFTLAAGLFLLGCESMNRSAGDAQENGQSEQAESRREAPPQRGLVPRTNPPARDLPVPVGFSLMEDESRSYMSGNMRFIDHTYQGRATKGDLQHFYREQLPVRGWKLQNAQMVRGTHILRYEKDDEALDVQIYDDDRLFRGAYSRVTLLVQALEDAPETPEPK